MASVQAHYESHLAPLYTWICGGAAGPRARFTELLNAYGLRPLRRDATAIDLGAGSGFQTLPLAAAGYTVTAIDLSATLLAELNRDATTAGLSARVHPLDGDLCDLARHASTLAPELIVCAGDTLTHLTSLDQVDHLLRDAATALVAGGHLILTFRDYTTARTGADRFISVRSEADRIFTCFLDYGPTHVTVHDILHTRDATAPGWKMSMSTYEKLRLAPALVRDLLLASGLTLVRDDLTAGLATFIAKRALAS